MKRLNAVPALLFLVLAAVARLSAADAPSAKPTPEAEQARDLVRLLAAEDFAVREDATTRLRALGKGAEAALKEGLGSDDMEVRRRCVDLLQLANRSELEVALAEFLVSRDDKVLTRLPAYPRYVKAAGDSPQARSLFVEMCLTDAALMIDADKDPAAATAVIVARCQDQQQKMRFGIQPMPLGQIAVLLYVAGDERVNLELTNLYVICNLLYHQETRNHIEGNPAARKLLLAFLERRNEPSFVYQKLNVVQLYNVKEGLPWALKLAADKGQQPHVRAQALSLIGRLGTKDNVADVEPLLSETAVIGQLQFNQTRINTELRDVALGVLVMLSGQRLEDYEFPYFVQFPQVLNQMRTNPNGFTLPYSCLGFSDAAARDKAQKKWKDSIPAKK